LESKVSIFFSYLEYKEVTITHGYIYSLFLDIVTISVKAVNHSGQSLGGEMMFPVAAAIALRVAQ
jgi:hypothetical protein